MEKGEVMTKQHIEKKEGEIVKLDKDQGLFGKYIYIYIFIDLATQK